MYEISERFVAGLFDRRMLARSGTFRDYVRYRKYDFGRGTGEAWSFIAYVRGDGDFPDVASWRDLDAYLTRVCAPEPMRVGAKSVWRSFTAYRSRSRPQTEGVANDR